MVKCTPEHSQSNRIVERFSAVVVKIIYATMAEGRDSRTEVQRCQLNHHNSMQSSTGNSPANLII